MSNAELDEAGKAEAIKAMVGKSFVPTAKYNTAVQNAKAQTDAIKTEFEAFKQEKMTDEERKAEAEKVREETYKKQNLIISKMYAENTFAKAGFKEEDYKTILDGIVQEDSEKTKALAETICNTMLKQKQDIEKAVTDKIVQGTKTPPAGNDNNSGAESDVEKYKKSYEDALRTNDYGKMAYYTRLMQEAESKK